MQCEVLEESPGPEPYQLLLAVSGFAAFSTLESEHGLHLLETPADDGKKTRKVAARVRVVAQPEDPPQAGESLSRQAHGVLAAESVDNPVIVRRYREEPSPLVRDVVRGWRSGRLDRVLQGDFDLLGADAAPTS
jgi:ATP-dependent Clp protease ATP-binding subunit ClpC